jgi:hypothetical protein
MGLKARERCKQMLYMHQMCGILVADKHDRLFHGFCHDTACGAKVALTRTQVRNRGSRGYIVCNALKKVAR